MSCTGAKIVFHLHSSLVEVGLQVHESNKTAWKMQLTPTNSLSLAKTEHQTLVGSMIYAQCGRASISGRQID